MRKDESNSQPDRPKVGLLVVDLDNTLWDWVGVWAQQFQAMLDLLAKETGENQADLKREIREVHQRRSTTEYSFLLDELPSLRPYLRGTTAQKRFEGALHIQNSKRYHLTRLYPGVLPTLMAVKASGVKIVAYTEPGAYWVEWRIRRTGLDGVINYLYSAPDHDFPVGVTPRKVRTRPANEYGLKKTIHLHVDRGILKPNPAVLSLIVLEHQVSATATVYVGDSLSKDVSMAQEVGVIDVHARYGDPTDRPGYELLTEVTQWTDEQVGAERIKPDHQPAPSYTLEHSLAELLSLFDFGIERRSEPLIEAWKQTVTVQQHFNDICWRIRGIGLTALTFVLTATYFVFTTLDTDRFDPAKSASLVCFIGVVIWCGFWFMDSAWYHHLLKGAVAEGELLERRLREIGVEIDLGSRITHASHDTTPANAWRRPKGLRVWVPRKASARLHAFYGALGGVIVATGLILAFFI